LQLFNEYADPGQYYDIALVIFESANHRNDMDIKAIWQMLIEQTHSKVQNDPEPVLLPYEAIINLIRDMANRLKNSETTFSPTMLIPLLELYALQEQNGIGARNWVMDLCIHVGWPFEIIIAVLNDMFYADTPPFQARNKQILADHILYCVGQWYDECMRSNQRLFGSEENAQEICTMLDELVNSGLTAEETEVANVLRRKIERSFRW
jgi:nuclear pore complex protein Nup155